MKKFSFAARLGVATSALALACLAWNFTPSAFAQTKSSSSLTPAARARFAKQLQVIQTFRNSLSPSQKKLPPSLLMAKPGATRTRAALPSFARSRSLRSLQRAQSVLIYGKMTSRIKGAIQREGQLTGFFPESGMASAILSTTAMEHIASATEVTSIVINPGPYTKDTPSRGVASASSGATPRADTGSVVSEGDTTHQAAQARGTFKVSGAGVKVGVISDSVESLKKLQESGELPRDVKVLTGQAGSGHSEGTAMMEIIHDLAPDAKLEFSTSGPTPEQMAKNILALQKDGCKVIVDDVGFALESVYQEDVVSAAIRQVSAAGVVYLTAIGNDYNRRLGPTTSWDGYFVNGATASQVQFAGGGSAILNDWNSQKDYFNEVTGGSFDIAATLTWADPNGKSGNDYDLFDVDSNGDIVDYSADVQDGNDQPRETLTDVYEGDSIVVTRAGNSKLLPMRLFMVGGYSAPTLEHSVGPTGYGHGVAEFAVSVGAAPAQSPGPYPGAFTKKSTLENFSSTGPRTLYFNSSGQPQERVIKKPDITAADKVSCATPGFETFQGTSAAAPHAAAIAALAISANPGASADKIKERLKNGVIDIGAPGFENDSGYGIVMAPLVLAYTDPTPTPIPTATATPIPTATPRPTPGPTATPAPGVSSIAFSEPSYSVQENARVATISVKRTPLSGQSSAGEVSVKYQTTTGGTATSGADYTVVTGTLSWASGDNSVKTFTVPIIDDSAHEVSETVALRIYDVVGRASILSTRKTATLTILDNDAESNDRILPTVAITNPSNGVHVSNVNIIQGTVADEGGSKVASVLLFIRRPTDGYYWTGTEWVAQQTALATVVSGNVWKRIGGNPPQAGASDDFLLITALATDGAGNKAQTSVSVFLDATGPQVSIFTPAVGAQLRALTRSNGTVSDEEGDSTLVVYLRRASDNKYWTGVDDNWEVKATPLEVQLFASGEWTRSQWPTLPAGNYSITATGTDEVGNKGSLTNEFSVVASPTKPSGSGGGA